MNNVLMATSTADEMNKWAEDLWATFKAMPNITKEQLDVIVPKIKFVSDKFIPTSIIAMGLELGTKR